MATTPQDQRRVDQTAMPGVRITAAPTANALGAGVAQVGEGVGLAVYARAVREANQTAFLSADRQLADTAMRLQVKLGEMKGRDAMGAPDLLRDEFDKAAGELEQKALSNDQQRQAFERARGQRWSELNHAIQRHVSAEKTAYEDGETVAYINSSVNNARLNAGNTGQVELELQRQEAVLREWAQRKGLGRYEDREVLGPAPGQPIPIEPLPGEGIGEYMDAVDRFKRTRAYRERGEPFMEEGPKRKERVWVGTPAYEEKLAEIQSRTNTEVIKGLLLKGSDREARAYFNGRREKFVAADRDVVERLLDEGSTRGEAQRQARALIAQHPDRFGDAVKGAEQIDDPKVQQLTRELVKQHFSDMEIQQKRDLDNNYLEITNVIDRLVKDRRGVPFLAREVIPAERWTQLSLGERSAVQAYIDHATKPADRPNDDETWLTFLELPTEKKAALSKREYDSQFRQHFSQAFQTRADGLWEAARGAADRKEQKDPELTATVTPLQQITQTFRTSGLVNPDREVGKFTNDEMKMFVRFEQQATAAIEQEELAKKRKLTPTERQGVIDQVKDRAVREVWVPGTFFDSKKPVIGLEEDEKGLATVPVDKIPAAHLEMMKNYMLSNGKQPTLDKLRRAYGQFIQGNRAGFERIANE